MLILQNWWDSCGGTQARRVSSWFLAQRAPEVYVSYAARPFSFSRRERRRLA